ncbi:MAG: hypothetical protein LBD08_07465, partial [Treponema sp.]|nr:hypothetical protein [Treponema sp.]
MRNRRLFILLGALTVLLASGLVLAGCDLFGKAATGCANSGVCVYNPAEKETKTCTQTACNVYKA